MSSKQPIQFCHWYHPDLVPKHEGIWYWVVCKIDSPEGVLPGFGCPCYWRAVDRCFRHGVTDIRIPARLVMILPNNDQDYPELEP